MIYILNDIYPTIFVLDFIEFIDIIFTIVNCLELRSGDLREQDTLYSGKSGVLDLHTIRS